MSHLEGESRMVDTQVSDAMTTGIRAAKAGASLVARQYLERAVRENPDDANGWLWLAWTAESPRSAILFLEEALQRDPRNRAARAGMEWACKLDEFDPPSGSTAGAVASVVDEVEQAMDAISAAADSEWIELPLDEQPAEVAGAQPSTPDSKALSKPQTGEKDEPPSAGSAKKTTDGANDLQPADIDSDRAADVDASAVENVRQTVPFSPPMAAHAAVEDEAAEPRREDAGAESAAPEPSGAKQTESRSAKPPVHADFPKDAEARQQEKEDSSGSSTRTTSIAAVEREAGGPTSTVPISAVVDEPASNRAGATSGAGESLEHAALAESEEPLQDPASTSERDDERPRGEQTDDRHPSPPSEAAEDASQSENLVLDAAEYVDDPQLAESVGATCLGDGPPWAAAEGYEGGEFICGGAAGELQKDAQESDFTVEQSETAADALTPLDAELAEPVAEESSPVADGRPAEPSKSEAAQCGAKAEENDAASAAAPINQSLVMVVDPSATVRQLATATFQKRGYEVLALEGEADALQAIARSRPVVLFIEADLGGVDGRQLCKKIKKQASISDTHVVLISGKEGLLDKLRGKLGGGDDFLAKPFSPSDLMRKAEPFLAAPANA